MQSERRWIRNGLIFAGLLTMLTLVSGAYADTQTFVINNSPNSFPMFHNASYVKFTIGNDTINLTLDINATFDGVCNLSNLTGTNISAAGSSAELEYMPVSYQTDTYDYKWNAAPYFNESEHKLYLLSGSGNVITCRLNLEENATATAPTIPKVVGVGDLVGVFSITTAARSEDSTYNNLTANIKGVGYMDLFAQYAPGTTYERTPYLPEFWHCEHAQGTVAANNTHLTVNANIIGLLNGSAAIEGVAHEWDMAFEFEVEYMPVSYQTGTYDHKWELIPLYNETEGKLYLLNGSGNVITCRLNLEENATATAPTIPKVVGVGDLVGVFSITTAARSEDSTYNNLIANIKGVGYMDLFAQYAPGTTYERTPYLPEFWHCEHAQGTVAANNTHLTVDANVIGLLNGSAAIEGVAHEWDMAFEFEVEYMPVSYQTGTYDHKWELIPRYNETEGKLYLLNGSGNVITCRLNLEENATATAPTIPKVVGVGDLVGVFSITTGARSEDSTYNDLTANIKGVGYMHLAAEYAPGTTFAEITFMPTFSHCEAWQGRIVSFSGSSESRVDYDIYMVGVAEGIEYLTFNGLPLEGVTLDATFDLEYHLVNISGSTFVEKWSIKPWQYNGILVILRGTGTMNEINFTFNDTSPALPEIISCGYLRGYDNLSAIIHPHYLSVLANGSTVAAMDDAGHGGFGITCYVNCLSGYKLSASSGLGLANWTINVMNSTGVVVGSTKTNGIGHWQICGFVPGTYTVCEEPQAGWTAENPASGCHENITIVDTNLTSLNFTNWQAITIPTATGTGNATITSSSGYICDATAVDESYFLGNVPDPVLTFTHGFFNITICGLNKTNPETITINITFPSAIPTDAEFWKYNTSTGTWYPFPFGDNDGDNVISITLTDNGPGDHNPTLGTINDPNGIGWRPLAPPPSQVQVPAVTSVGIIALVGLLSAFATVAIARKRR